MLITAPEDLEEAIEHVFRCLRNLRDHIDEPSKDTRWEDALTAVEHAIHSLRRAMREDLAMSA
jgi:hypothetical protein